MSKIDNERIAKVINDLLAHSGISDAATEDKFADDVKAESEARKLVRELCPPPSKPKVPVLPKWWEMPEETRLAIQGTRNFIDTEDMWNAIRDITAKEAPAKKLPDTYTVMIASNTRHSVDRDIGIFLDGVKNFMVPLLDSAGWDLTIKDIPRGYSVIDYNITISRKAEK